MVSSASHKIATPAERQVTERAWIGRGIRKHSDEKNAKPLCRLGLDGDVPDHSTFSKNRHGRFRESDLLRKLFETVVARYMKEGIVGGEAFAADASIIVADAHRRRGVAKIEDLTRPMMSSPPWYGDGSWEFTTTTTGTLHLRTPA